MASELLKTRHGRRFHRQAPEAELQNRRRFLLLLLEEDLEGCEGAFTSSRPRRRACSFQNILLTLGKMTCMPGKENVKTDCEESGLFLPFALLSWRKSLGS